LARLNGRDVHREFLSGVGGLKPAQLGADDGLRFGRNQLVVTAFDEHGPADTDRRSFTIARRAPLAAAGPDRRADTGAPLRFDGRRSQPARPGDELRFRWSIVNAPRGSTARIAGTRSARPSFVPDKAGRYRLRLKVIEPARGTRAGSSVAQASQSTPDQLQPAATLTDQQDVEIVGSPPTPPIGFPVSTMPATGNGIEFDGQLYPASGDWVQLLVLNRQTHEVMSQSTSFSYGASPQLLSSAIGRLKSGQIAILTGGGRAFPTLDRNHWNALKYVYRQLGGQTYQGGTTSKMDPSFRSGNWSLIGVPGLGQGQGFNSPEIATIAEPTRFGNLTGYFQQDQHANYTFTFGDYVPFDTNATNQQSAQGGGQNVIQIGTSIGNGSVDRYPSATLGPGESGFQVLVLNAGTLYPVPDGNQTFTTNEGPGVANDAGVTAMQQFISRWSDNQTLFMVQSIGSPSPADQVWAGPLPSRQQPLVNAITELGGNRDVFNALPSTGGGYTLVTPSQQYDLPAAEQALIPGQPSPISPNQLVGTLERARDAIFHASSAFALDSVDTSMLPIAYQPSQPWPYSDPKDEGHYAALQYISQELANDGIGFRDNIRINYYRSGFLGSDYSTLLQAVQYPNPNAGGFSDVIPFTPQEFGDVKNQLVLELAYVRAVRGVISAFRTALLQAQAGGQTSIHEVAQQIESAVDAHGGDSTLINVLDVADEGAEVVNLLNPELGAASGAMGGILALMGITANSEGGKPLVGELKTQAEHLGWDVQNAYEDAYPALDHAGDLLVSDWGKLSIAGPKSLNAQNGWDLSNSDTDVLAGYFTNGIERLMWEKLMPTAYWVYDLGPGRSGSTSKFQYVTDPRRYGCIKGIFNTSTQQAEPRRRAGAPGRLPPPPPKNPWEHVFPTEPDSAWALVLAGFPGSFENNPPLARPRALAGKSDVHTKKGNTIIANPFPDLPSAGLTNQLFQPIADGGLGFTKESFFDSNFHIEQLNCPLK
jgi:hypothetical protein